MSVASAVIRTPTAAPSQPPSLPELEDLLYDLLASGTDPNLPEGTLEVVQGFVHEHARSKKSHAEFVAFFEANSLPFKAPGPSLLALPPIESRGHAAETPALSMIPQAPDTAGLTTAANSGMRRSAGIIPALTLAAVSCGFAAAGFGLYALHSELVQLRRESAEGASALARLRAENSEQQRQLNEMTQQLERIDRKTEWLLQSFASPIKPNVR